MKIRRSFLEEDNRDWGVGINRLGRELKCSPAFISRIKNNKVVISEELYHKIQKVLTNIRNNDKV